MGLMASASLEQFSGFVSIDDSSGAMGSLGSESVDGAI
jgi:hypothetical protein